jgi:hypothetical protein
LNRPNSFCPKENIGNVSRYHLPTYRTGCDVKPRPSNHVDARSSS